MKDYKRILIKVSGEVLQGKCHSCIDNNAVTQIAQELIEVHNKGIEMGVVIGGGNFFRGASSVGNKMKRTDADNIGMLATIQNSIVLNEKFRELHTDSVVFTSQNIGNIGLPFNAERAKSALTNGKIVVFGGGTGNPFFTTDTAAILRTLEIEADIVLKGTKVDGVYDKDPIKFEDAKFFKTISFDDYIKLNLKIMDLTAISLAKEFHLPIKIFNINYYGNIQRAIFEDDFGSLIQ
ncbi:MAG: UMP kinase [Candidatus Cloacimonetes bacterium]|nr:UMP kinase [Candidatus Cloacimonadota bacterium]MBL7085629.1 UMP kinase [Candidatus Cloacimonadota bacterium]